ncbi:MAG TPA: aldehyde dehydrogenase family protein [Polyangiaceae bacterium]|nr:aldehyde dehydrogenase family protein [Polyangiaceae bacterium]
MSVQHPPGRPVGSPAGDSAFRRAIPCHEPATGKVLGEAEAMDATAVREVVRKARAAQAAWGQTSFAERRAFMRELLDEILASQERICEIAVRDSGKTMVDAALGEVFPVCEKIRYLIENGEDDLRPEERSSGFLQHKRARVEYHPLGVVAVICPWNFPFHNIYCPMVPALFAGNAVVAKVGEHTTWSAEPLMAITKRVLERRGHDPELVQLVIGYGDSGEALVRSDVDKVFFTGSPENGVKVMAAASDRLTPVVLELGGKDPMIVCDDADLDHAVEQAMLGVFTACGQMCVGAERIYVQAGVYDEFLRRALARVETLRQGSALDEQVDLGAMTMPRQLDILDELVADARAKGARVLIGGERNASAGEQFFSPTILADVHHGMRITQEEQFGPIMVVMKFDTDREAVRLANDCPYGLGSSIFSRDPARAERIAAAVRAGMTVINDYGLAYMIQSLPFGGVGRSGFGRINGREGLRACCNTKAVVTDRVALGGGVSVYPIVDATFPLVRNVIETIYAPTAMAKGRAAGRTLRHAVDVARARMAFRKRGR